ncbi:DUF4169 family protein [Hyphomonas sp.]|jgi:hypothetical protein|uniref:DUF4169 family protein n=1 Tax=Hyphomonas sp. TaxID=87 RepID=UPI0032D97B9A
MADPINLNKFRKAKAKVDKAQQAQENRAKFGRTKTEKSLEQARADKARRETDAHRREDDPEDRG